VFTDSKFANSLSVFNDSKIALSSSVDLGWIENRSFLISWMRWPRSAFRIARYRRLIHDSNDEQRTRSIMPGKQAKILSTDNIKSLLAYASNTRHPHRNRVVVLLSIKAGLRAGEIASLTWDMVVSPSGDIGQIIELRNHAAKKNSGRIIPIHPDLQQALARWCRLTVDNGYVVRSERNGPMTPLSIVVWFSRAYEAIGLAGCSSHSGRRTFITRAARLVHKAGGSLRDVQLLAGHRSIITTQRYIDGDSDSQRKLVSMI
jgi:integrase